MLNFCDFIQVYVFTTNHHLNVISSVPQKQSEMNCEEMNCEEMNCHKTDIPLAQNSRIQTL